MRYWFGWLHYWGYVEATTPALARRSARKRLKDEIGVDVRPREIAVEIRRGA